MNRTDLESIITDLVTAQLEQGRVPWRKTWTPASTAPRNICTGSEYHGVNWLLLSMQDVTHQLWMTYKQAQDLGGQVVKGSKGIHLVKYGTFKKGTRDDGSDIIVPFVNPFVVFNISQTSGIDIPARYLVKRDPVAILPAVDKILADYVNQPTITHSDMTATPNYSPITDSINMPSVNLFDTPSEYAHTLGHELTHSTGHKSRCDRDIMNRFGCEGYAREELVAEIGSCMLMSEYGVDIHLQNSASYIASWLQALKNDPTMIMKASALAQKATDRITGTATITEEAEAK